MSAEEHVQKASAHDSAGAVDPKVSRDGCDSFFLLRILTLSLATSDRQHPLAPRRLR
jgi:hypothetical protein